MQQAMIAKLTSFFGILALVLASIGLYGVTSYSVERRTSEIGIRMALGATQRDVLVMVQKTALMMAGAGVVLGVPLAFAAERVAVTFVDNMATGFAMPVAAAAAMIAVALLAASVPARRASRVNPIEALRQE
jgi:ABC-type antimicrobial peptide transport system permease subunit